MPTAESDRPIGVFDSGFGGLSVLRELLRTLPFERFVYVGDTANYPYGARSLDDIAGLAATIGERLVAEQRVKAIVVACNSAATALTHVGFEGWPVPTATVVRPGCDALVAATRTGSVAVLGTVATVRSRVYSNVIRTIDPACEVREVACPGLVEFVERGVWSGPEIELLSERLLHPLHTDPPDAVLLGCTHYPFISDVLSSTLAPGTAMVDSAASVAAHLAAMLRDAGLDGRRRTSGRLSVFSSGDIAWFKRLGSRLLEHNIGRVSRW